MSLERTRVTLVLYFRLSVQTFGSKVSEMTTYLVCLSGRNFLIDSKEGPRKKKFRSTRLVESENKNLAESYARELISNDPRIQNFVLNEASDPPVIYLESISEVPAMAYDAQRRANSFYWENEDDH